jgi:hypothetical protein
MKNYKAISILSFILIITIYYILKTVSIPNQEFDAFRIYPLGYKALNVHQYEKTMPLLITEKFNKYLVLIFCLYFLNVVTIGRYLYDNYFNIHDYGWNLKTICISFLLGYLIQISINRIISFFIPNYYCIILITFIVLLNILYAIRRFIYIKNKFNSILSLLLFGILFIILLVWNVQHRRNHGTGDATGDTFRLIYNNPIYAPQTGEYFPVITQHYDEVLFLYPIIYFIKNISNSDILKCYWILNSLSILTAFVVLYEFIKLYKLNKYNSFLITFLCFSGGIGLTPLSDQELFDSSNPLMYCVHIGRVISGISIFLLITLNIFYSKSNNSYSYFFYFVVFLLGIGFSAISIHVFLLLLGTYILISLLDFKIIHLSGISYIFILTLLLPILLFNIEGTSRELSLNAFFCISILIIFIYYSVLRNTIILTNNNISINLNKCNFIRNSLLLNMVLGFTIGSLFLGSIFCVVKCKYIVNRLPVPSKFGFNKLDLTLNPVFISGSSAVYFMSFYGLPIILSSFALLKYYLTKIYHKYMKYIIILIGFYYISIYTYYFLFNNNLEWEIFVRTRLIEGYFYALIIISLIYILNVKNFVLKYCSSILITIWILIPLLYWPTSRIHQWIINFNWLVHKSYDM